MPIAGYKNFDACVKGMMDKQGYDEETARKVCGKIEADMNKSADDLLTEMKAEYGEETRLFLGKLSVDIKDNQNDRISPEAFEKVMPIFMKRGVLIDTHSNKVVGKPLRYWMRDGDKGTEVVVGWQVYDDYSIDDDIWNKIRGGDYTGLSIGGMALPDKQNIVCGKDGCYVQIDGIELWEGSAVEKPANKEAKIIAVNELAKSEITVMPEDGLMAKNEDIMADTELEKETTEETPSASEGESLVEKQDEMAPPEEGAGNDIETKLEAVIDLLQSLTSRVDSIEEQIAPVEKQDDEDKKDEDDEETDDEDEVEKSETPAVDIDKAVTDALEKSVPKVLEKTLQKMGFVAADRPNMKGGKPLIKDNTPKVLTLEEIAKKSFDELNHLEVA